MGQLALALADPAARAEFGHLFDESRLVHVSSLDFLTLSSLAPFWVANDAAARGWKGPALALACLPVVGPAAYLCLRPRAAAG